MSPPLRSIQVAIEASLHHAAQKDRFYEVKETPFLDNYYLILQSSSRNVLFALQLLL